VAFQRRPRAVLRRITGSCYATEDQPGNWYEISWPFRQWVIGRFSTPISPRDVFYRIVTSSSSTGTATP
jgi:hypothetical protein